MYLSFRWPTVVCAWIVTFIMCEMVYFYITLSQNQVPFTIWASMIIGFIRDCWVDVLTSTFLYSTEQWYTGHNDTYTILKFFNFVPMKKPLQFFLKTK